MNINYEKRNNSYSTIDKFDSTKNNILLLGSSSTEKERCNIINPRGIYNAAMLYGTDSDLYKAYYECFSITEEYNIFTVNCKTYSDFLNIMDLVLHYNFSFVVPMGIKMEDTFYNENSKQYEYYIDYFMYLIEEYQSITTIIMTSNHAKHYNDIDEFLNYNNKVLEDYYTHTAYDNDNYLLYSRNGSDIIFVINNLVDVAYSNAILAAQLSLSNFTEYPKNIDYATYYDIDKSDAGNNSYAYHKYNYLSNNTSIDNLVNMRLYEDVYKNALVDSVIKSIFRLLDFDKYRGRLYNAYVKLQIERSAKAILDDLKGSHFKNYEIKNIGFVKTEDTSGYIYIELLIMPYGFMEYIDVIMEV